MKNIFKAVFIISVFSVLTRLGGFIFRIFLSRAIGAEGMGLYQITMSVFSLLVTVTSSGIPLVVSKRTAELNASGDKRAGHGTVTAALITALAASGVIVSFLFIAQDLTGKLFADTRNLRMLLVLLPAVVVSSFYSSFRGGLWGGKKFFAYGLAEFLEQYIRIGIGVVMLQGLFTMFEGSMRAAVSLSVSYFAAAGVAAVIYFFTGGRLADPKPHFKPLVKSAAPITVIRIAGGLLTALIALLIPLRLAAGGLDKSEALSQMGSASGMALPLLSIPITLISSLALALVPELSAIKKDSAAVEKNVSAALKISVLLAGLFVPLFAAAGPDLCRVLFRDTLSGRLVALGAFSVIPTALSLITSSILNSLGQELKALKCYIISSAVLLVCIWLLPPVMGVTGVIVSTYVSMTLTALLNLRILSKSVPLGKTSLSLLLAALLTLPVSFFAYYLYGLLTAVLPALPALLLLAPAASAFYLLLCRLFNLVDLSDLLKRFKRKKAGA